MNGSDSSEGSVGYQPQASERGTLKHGRGLRPSAEVDTSWILTTRSSESIEIVVGREEREMETQQHSTRPTVPLFGWSSGSRIRSVHLLCVRITVNHTMLVLVSGANQVADDVTTVLDPAAATYWLCMSVQESTPTHTVFDPAAAARSLCVSACFLPTTRGYECQQHVPFQQQQQRRVKQYIIPPPLDTS